MSGKVLISGLENSGKTSLLQTLTDVLVVAHDGKKYPFAQPHVNVQAGQEGEGFIVAGQVYGGTAGLITITNEKVNAYKERFGKLPSTLVYDSSSKIFETLQNYCAAKYNGFAIFSELNKEIAMFTSYIENTLIANGVNVILVSHATWDVDTASYRLVGSGSFAKKGGFLAEVDNAIFVEKKSNKRVAHHRTGKFACRTILQDIPDSQDVSEYNLQEHLDKLLAVKDNVSEFTL